MAEIKQTGVKISQYKTAEIKNSKLVLDHYLISYAPAYFGTSTINKNFKVPVSLLREDITGYIGVYNTKSSWKDTINLWSGEWDSSNPINSYVYVWSESDKYKDGYIKNKHTFEDNIDKVFIIDNAPLPQTAEANIDPNPSTKKIVTKSYIDDRFNGMPKVKCTSSTLEMRSYPCLYEFEMDSVTNIDIVDTLVKDTITNKCVEFMLRIPTTSIFYEIGADIPPNTDFSVSANGTPCTWGYRNEILMIVSRAKNENAKDVWVRCFAEYVDGVFTVKCTNGLNVLENEVITGAAGVVYEIDEVYNGKEVPTEEAVVNYVHLHTDDDDIHVTTTDKELWNTTATNHIKDISLKSEYLTKVEIEGEETPNVFNLGLKTTDSITKSSAAKNSKAIPTTEAVVSFVEELEKNVQGKIDSINGTLENIPSSLDSSFNVKGLVVEQVDGVITKVEVNNASFDKEKNELVESTKDNVITGTEVQNLIDTVLAKFAEVGVNYKIADDLPSPNETHKGWVYLIPKSSKATQNEYFEFICVDKDNDTWAWEQIGTTKADLTDYIKEEEFSKKIEEINSAINAIETIVEEFDVDNTYTQNEFNLSFLFAEYANEDWVENTLMFVNENNIFIPGGSSLYTRTDDDTSSENKRPHFVPSLTSYDIIREAIENSSNANIKIIPQIKITNTNGVCDGFVPSAEAQKHIAEDLLSLRWSNSSLTDDEVIEKLREKIENFTNSSYLKTLEIRAAWLNDVKKGNNTTIIAFRNNSYTSSHYTRLFFYNLDKKYNKLGSNGEYGQPGSYSKKYMVNGLKVVFNARGMTDLEEVDDGLHYYTFTTNTWIGHQIKHDDDLTVNLRNLINWDIIPTPYNGPAYQDNWTYTDGFEYADSWDVAPTEQSFDSLLFNFIKLKNNFDELKNDFNNVKNEISSKIELVRESYSFGICDKHDDKSNTHGFIIVAPKTEAFDTITIRTGSSATTATNGEVYTVIHEEQEDGTKKELAASEVITMTSSYT